MACETSIISAFGAAFLMSIRLAYVKPCPLMPIRLACPNESFIMLILSSTPGKTVTSAFDLLALVSSSWLDSILTFPSG